MKIKFLTVLMLIAFSSLKAQELGPGMDIIGFGYDIFGKFADNSSKKPFQIFKFGADEQKRIGSSVYLVPSGVMLDNIGKKEKTVVSGSSQRDYAKSFGASVGVDIDALTFGASVNAAFSNSWGGSERQYFQTIRDANRTWRVSIDQRVDLKTILDPQAAKDINSMDPAKLFQLYGTHVIVSAYLGGRADYTSITKITQEYSEQEISLAASLSYTRVSANASTNYSQKQNNIISNTKTTLIVTGGNSEYASDINNFEAYKLWADGIRSLPVLCDFENGSLIPIWDLASTQQRKNALIAEFNKLAKQYPLPEAYAGIGVGMENNFFFVKSKSNGQYWDFAGYHFDAETQGGILGLSAKDVNDERKQGGDRIFKIIPHATEAVYAFFQPQHTNEVLDVAGGSKAPGGKIHLWPKGGDNVAQMFKMIEVSGEQNTFLIQNKNSGLFFTENGGKITQEAKTEADNQKWVFEKATVADMAAPPIPRIYIIERYGSTPSLVWDVKNGGGQGAEIQLFQPNGTDAQAFDVYKMGNNYLFTPMHNRSLRADLIAENGRPLRAWGLNNSNAQLFQFEWAGFPRVYYIKVAGTASYAGAISNYKNTAGHTVEAQAKSNNELQQWYMKEVSRAITNKHIGGWLNTISGPVYCTNVDNNNKKAQWFFHRIPGTEFVLIKNVADGTLLHIEYGKVEASKIGEGSHSAQWIIENIPGEKNVRLKNRWKGTYLNVETGHMQCTDIQPGWMSAKWDFQYK